jgi:hypothetical protein
MSDESTQNRFIKDILLAMTADVAQQSQTKDLIRDISEQWNELERIAESQQSTKDEREQARRTMDALAKGLPALAAGVRDAVKGFNSGDPFAGSAAIMDICGTLASTIGAMAGTLGGPPGALVGALFSIVSMVLKMFVKEQQSLAQKIEEIIRTIKSESKLQKLRVAQNSIEAFMTTVADSRATWKWSDHAAMLNVIDGPAINAIRGAAEWLEEPKNLDLPLWGHVLAAQCNAYIMLMQSVTIATAGVGRTDPDSEQSYPKLAVALESNHPIQLRFLERVRAAARDRGTVWHIGVTMVGQWRDAGALFVRDTAAGKWTELKGTQRVLAVASSTNTKKNLDPKPHLGVFALEMIGSESPGTPLSPAYRNRKNNRGYALFGNWPLQANTGWQEVPALANCYDIYATPGAKDGEIDVYTADGTQINRYVQGGTHGIGLTLSADVQFTTHRGYTADSVAAVRRPLMAAVEASKLSPSSRRVLSQDEEWVVYGGGIDPLGHRYIKAYFATGLQATFAAPAGDDTVGMKVDRTHLWAFSKTAIACATHASVKVCISDIRDTPANATAYAPDWAFYQVPPPLRGIGPSDIPGGLREIAPCDDGSLMAVFVTDRSQHVYQATPRIDHRIKGIVIGGSKLDNYGRAVATNGWSRVDDAQGNRLHKQPIFCWTLLDGLAGVLNKPAVAASVAMV